MCQGALAMKSLPLTLFQGRSGRRHSLVRNAHEQSNSWVILFLMFYLRNSVIKQACDIISPTAGVYDLLFPDRHIAFDDRMVLKWNRKLETTITPTSCSGITLLLNSSMCLITQQIFLPSQKLQPQSHQTATLTTLIAQHHIGQLGNTVAWPAAGFHNVVESPSRGRHSCFGTICSYSHTWNTWATIRWHCHDL